MTRSQKKDGTDIVDYVRIGGIVLSIIVMIAGALFLLPGSGDILKDLVGTREVPAVDFSTLEIPAGSHDYYLACPEDICLAQPPDQTLGVYDISAERLRSRLLAFVDSQPTISFWRMDPAVNQFDFLENDPSMRMPDVITVQTFDLGEGKSAIAIYSRSLHGLAGRGSNQERVQRWLAMIAPR